jgi:hypothetical protein
LKSHRRALQAAIANHTTAVARSIDDNFMSKDGKAAIRSAIDDAVRSIAAARLAVDVVEFRYVTVSRCITVACSRACRKEPELRRAT